MDQSKKTARNGGYRCGAKEDQHPVTGAVTAPSKHHLGRGCKSPMVCGVDLDFDMPAPDASALATRA